VKHLKQAPQKIGTVELLKVHKTARRLYVNIDKALADSYFIQPGDTLRVRIEELMKPEKGGKTQ
jgi:hypothetical protein